MNKLLMFMFLFLVVLSAVAQTPIEIFGYGQTTFTNFHNVWKQGPPDGEANYKFNYMGVNQLNLLITKDLGNNFSGLINFEFVNNYSSSKGFGSFSLQEAYARWDYADYLKVKFGVVIPQFLNLFEIYNKTPLLPYIMRPKLYEANQGNLIDIFNILPQKALLHVNGTIPVSTMRFEYSAFVGNPVNRFLSSPDNDLIPGYVAYGQSAVSYLTLGGRLGLGIDEFKLGISFASDKENQRRFVKDLDGNETDLGDLPRYKIGFDFSGTIGDFSLNAEYLMTKTSVPSTVQDSLDAWYAVNPYFIGKSFDKKFYYATLQYNITEQFFMYAMYDFLDDKTDPFFFGLDGYTGYHAGGGYAVTDAVVLKAQFTKNISRYDIGGTDIPVRDYSEYLFSVGISMTF